jgi:Cu-Zn family superoxide dismutase
MFKLSLLVLCLSICAVYGNHWKNNKSKRVFPIYARSVMFGHVWNEATKNFSTICGHVDFIQSAFEKPVEVMVNLTVKPAFDIGLKHGIHIHEFGTLWSKNTTTKCAATGAHFNPRNTTHGWRVSDTRHVGDLGNINYSAESGKILATFTDSWIHLSGFESIVGRSVVLHEKKDDGGLGGTPLSLTSGSSGARIACGDIVYSEKFESPFETTTPVAESTTPVLRTATTAAVVEPVISTTEKIITSTTVMPVLAKTTLAPEITTVKTTTTDETGKTKKVLTITKTETSEPIMASEMPKAVEKTTNSTILKKIAADSE